jgi:NAD+ synthase (glutamine-hydrolysing)
MPTRSVRVALLQLNPVVGDLAANAERILRGLRAAEDQGAQIAVTPELCLTGYPPEDLLLRPAFLRAVHRTLDHIAALTGDTALVCGHPELLWSPKGVRVLPAAPLTAARLRNSASVLRNGGKIACYRKIALPNYGVFDERRYFTAGDRPALIKIKSGNATRNLSLRSAISICEDLWPEAGGAYLDVLPDSGIDLLINLSASPFDRTKYPIRLDAMSRAARQARAHLVHVNLVGGQDELVFDGRSFVMDPKGRVVVQAKAFQEDCLIVDIPVGSDGSGPGPSALSKPGTIGRPGTQTPRPGSDEETLSAIELSLRDYVDKNGFASVGVAMSGGIDSALVAAIAVRALGAARVTGVTLPSRITSRQTLGDAVSQAGALGIRFYQIPIATLVSGFVKVLAPAVRGTSGGAMDENIQARVRGTLMMALSNRMGFLLLATGNKSELATGYCTLYGDMAGGFAPLKDLSKEWVYRLARCVNRLEGRSAIPLSVIRRAPSAELRPGQKDQDTLPPYPELDTILEGLIEKDLTGEELVRRGRKATWVEDTARRVYINEYKRRQAPLGPKVTPKAFGRDRRMPITQKGGPSF